VNLKKQITDYLEVPCRRFVPASDPAWAKVDMWWRATNCFRKIDGKWVVAHGHSSEPFDMESGKALLDLKP